MMNTFIWPLFRVCHFLLPVFSREMAGWQIDKFLHATNANNRRDFNLMPLLLGFTCGLLLSSLL